MANAVKRISTKRGPRFVEILPTGQYKFIKESLYRSRKGLKKAQVRGGGGSKNAASDTKRVRNVAPKKKNKRRRKFTIPLAAAIPVAAVAVHVASFPGGLNDKMHEANRIFTGYDIRDGSFDMRRLSFGLAPILIGLGIHKMAGMLGFNRALGQARLPFLRL